MHLFLQHKQDHIKVEQQSVDVNQYLESKPTQVVPADVCQNRAQYHPQVTYDQINQLNEPIILQESDMLFRYIFIISFMIYMCNLFNFAHLPAKQF